MLEAGTTFWARGANTRSSGLEVLKRSPIGQPDRPRTRYCSIGFQPVSSVHGTQARQAKPLCAHGEKRPGSVRAGTAEGALVKRSLPLARLQPLIRPGERKIVAALKTRILAIGQGQPLSRQ